jgi:hypothetical protein
MVRLQKVAASEDKRLTCAVRNTIARPAELPPPTSATSLPAQRRASIGEAPIGNARPNTAIARNLQRETPARAIEPFDLDGHDDLGSFKA